ncbi:structural maintenance of chromosomes 1 [Micractinium conductrix]|uniref:Structural maintenance of chromosomes protein n=1 Tax=Micractinium conductrix TaxID=554055 RepID=A0A2P6V3P2_9CHLO|nr:structural maintenance of chromosomes 1 [Micractinium conductrix]|eukprot:PSC68712.1 structural maintenance of chromosomes 1 [Micractinium conductrix]
MAEEGVRGRILRLEVNSFKSYRGHNVIGPFKPFTTIIGPNGSGKSNVMDAISFVLGVRTAQLRGSLKELLYLNTAGQSAEDRPRKGSVKLVFEAPDGEEVHFERAIKPSGAGADSFTSEYKINDRAVGWEQYNSRLERYNILVKARNFLVFQGDIENVAQMQPRDLTNLFEHISGSAAYRQEYEDLEKKKAEAEERVSYIFSRKKAITQEKKQKKDQKEEAEKHQRLQEELDEARSAYFTWQVYQLDGDAGDAEREIRGLREQLAEAERSLQVAERAAEEKKREQAGLQKDRLLLEKRAKKKQADADKRNPEAYKLREEIARHARRLKSGEKELGERRRKAEEAGARVASLRDQLEQLQDAQKALEAEAKQGQRGKLRLAPELAEEYNRIKQEVKVKTAAMDADLASKQSALEAQEQARDMAAEKVETMAARMAALAQQKAAAEARHDTVAMSLGDKERQLAEGHAELDRVLKEGRHVESQRNRLALQLQDVDGQLREARQARKESERDRRVNEAISQLKVLHRDRVYGRVAHLADIQDKRYVLALTAAMGKDFDGIIVKDAEMAKAGIRHFRENRLPPHTFIPADDIKVKGVPDALRNQLRQRGVGKLAVDLVMPRAQGLERVFQMLLGTTIVTDTPQQAREVAFGSAQRQKVVSLDGTIINKAGIITGGFNTGLEARAGQWDGGALDELKVKQARAAEALDGLRPQREMVAEQQELQARISGLENELSLLRVDIRASRDKAQRAQQDAAALEQERERVAPELERAEDAITEAQREVTKLKKRVDQILDRAFANFSKKAGVSSIREYEETHLKETQRLQKERVELATQTAKVRQQMEYEQKSGASLADAIAAKEAELDKERAALEAAEAAGARHAAEGEATQAEIAELAQQVAAKRGELEALEADLKEYRERVAQAKDAVAKHRRSIGAKQAAAEDLLSQRADVLEGARMEHVELPVLAGGDAQAVDDEEEEAAGMEVDGEEGGAGPSSAPRAGKRKVRLDFSHLPPEARLRDKKNRERWERERLAEIEECREQMARLAPNLKAVDQYEAIKEKEREQLEELEAARRESKAASEAFQAVQGARHEAFSAAFQHVAQHIDPIYKELTRSAVHPVGGQAYLSLDSSDEPYLHGIKFTAMPPTKRFRDMEQLSGGEKTVAALALLFAIHSYQPSPFFVLDEVDAALDATNVVRVATYMRHMTRGDTQGCFQGIVISLKDVFFEKADALVGVARDPRRGCSETYTFDLDRFPPPAAVP